MTFHAWARSERPLVFAHRGGSRLAPENSLAAFDRAVAEGVDGLELDVRFSRDLEVVVYHDGTLDRTTDATGPVSALTARELAAVDAGYHFTPVSLGSAARSASASTSHPFRGCGVGVPLLRDVVARYPQHRLIVELKEDLPPLAEAAVSILRSAGAIGRTCLGSFHRRPLEVARAIEPSLATGAASEEVRRILYRSWFGLFPRRVAFDALQVPERREGICVVTPRFIRGAHRAGVPVQVWIVDAEEDIRRLLDWGADALITDRPDVAVPTVLAWSDRREGSGREACSSDSRGGG